MLTTALTWYLPSFFGDIRLDATEDGHTKITWYKLSAAEAFALGKLREASTSIRRGWASKDDWERVPIEAFKPGDTRETSVLLKGRIDKVESVLTRALKPERKTLRVVRIHGGDIEEIHERAFDQAAIEAKHPYRDASEETALAVKEQDKPAKPAAAAVATTVAAPVLGCPAPDFDQVHLRATRVLKAFLTPDQIDDFERHQRFIVTGADTGHRYMLTSRNAPDELARGGGRTVFDLDEHRAFCVHDWAIPAEEELLTMGLLLQLPGREVWMREIPDELSDATRGFICGPMPA